MGKFDGILLCTDLDDTLLTTDKRVSDENSKAIEYFKSEGGLFTFATVLRLIILETFKYLSNLPKFS